MEQKRTKCEIWSRSIGYLRPVEQWNDGAQTQFADRVTYDNTKIVEEGGETHAE